MRETLTSASGDAGRRFAAGDGLRALAALSVAAYHAAFLALIFDGATEHPPSFDLYGGSALPFVLHNLDLGLYVFFVLSGYLIARPYIRAYVAGHPAPDWRRYARNRMLRIVPAFWAVYTVMLLAHGTAGDSAGQILAVYGFAQLWEPGTTALYVGPAWTLGVEIAFYLLVPVAALAAHRLSPPAWTPARRSAAVLGAAGTVTAASLLARALGPQTPGFGGSLPALAFAFMPGVALATAEVTIRPRLDPRRLRAVGLAAMALGAGALLAAALVPVGRHEFGPQIPAARALLATLAAGLLIAAALLREWRGLRPIRLLDNRPILMLGLWSYSIYLIHQGLYFGLDSLSNRAGPRESLIVLVAIGLPLVVGAAAISYALVERPALERRLPWRNRRAPVRAGAEAAVAVARSRP